VYLAARRVKDIFRSGEKTISDAIRKGTACWAIDEETLYQMKRQGIRYVGVKLATGDKWITCIDNFYNRQLSKFLNYQNRGGAEQRYLPFQHFTYIPARPIVK
jgi:hypothetical protein